MMKFGPLATPYPGTIETLRELVTYSPLTGDMVTSQGYYNKPTRRGTGYNTIRVPIHREAVKYGKRRTAEFRCDHIAWAVVSGHWPTGRIEHLNGLKFDDSLKNLVHLDHEGKRWWLEPAGVGYHLVEVMGNMFNTGPEVILADEPDPIQPRKVENERDTETPHTEDHPDLPFL